MPPAAPVTGTKNGMMWIAALVVAAGGYYYYTHNMRPQAPADQTPPGQTQPGNPGSSREIRGSSRADPGQQPGGIRGSSQGDIRGNSQRGIRGSSQEGILGSNRRQPRDSSQEGSWATTGRARNRNQALVQAQQFAWKGQPSNGQIQITQAQWRTVRM